MPANANTDDLFEAESGQDESIAAHTPISSDLSLTLSIVAQVREESDDEANSNDSCEDLDGEEPSTNSVQGVSRMLQANL